MSRDMERRNRDQSGRSKDKTTKESAQTGRPADDTRRRAETEDLPRQRGAGYHSQTGTASSVPTQKPEAEESVKTPARHNADYQGQAEPVSSNPARTQPEIGTARKPSRLTFTVDELPKRNTGQPEPKGRRRNQPRPVSSNPANGRKSEGGHSSVTSETQKKKLKRKLYFEADKKKKTLPEKSKGHLPVKAADAARLSARSKMREGRDENAGADAMDAGVTASEGAVSSALRRNSEVRSKRTIQKSPRFTKRPEVRNTNFTPKSKRSMSASSAANRGTGKSGVTQKKSSNAVSRYFQKRRIKKGYAASAKAKGAKNTRKAANSTGKKVKRVASAAARHPAVFGIIGALVLLLIIIFSLFSSCSNIGMGGLSTIAASSYLAENEDIDDAELYYTEWETDLLMEAQNAQNTHKGYDEYRYNIGDVGHSPYDLMAYLTSKYEDFTYANIKGDLSKIFNAQYSLTFTEKIEIRYRTEQQTNDAGETVSVQVPYEYKILIVTLNAKSLTDVLSPLMDQGELEHYAILVQSKGLRQITGSPLDMNWLPNVTSYYGYRVHPISGEKNFHKGVDVSAATGTKVYAAHDGTISTGNDADGYGRYITLTGKDGLVTKYAHLSKFLVSSGSSVKKGDVIAESGNTGSSTGPHLHFEIIKNGRYLNPLYFAETNDDGSPAPGTGGGREIPDYPGEPMDDSKFAALMEEAQKHLGKPYVFGASGPNSFDCSGFVCYTFNHSGVKSVGRTTAQGLYNMSTPIAAKNLKPGDLVFFTKTYSTPNAVSHIGIYIGNGKMIHAGDPVQYADLSLSYWQNHFYAYGRL